MSYTFSRRSFLKYTAAAAVAVAGSSLLTGCNIPDPNNPSSTRLDSSLTINQVTARLTKEGTDLTNGVFRLTIKSSYDLPIYLEPDRFCVTVLETDGDTTTTKYYSPNNGGVTCNIVDGAPSKPRLYSGETATVEITAPNYTAEAGQTVFFQYMPVRESSAYSMGWKVTVE